MGNVTVTQNGGREMEDGEDSWRTGDGKLEDWRLSDRDSGRETDTEDGRRKTRGLETE